jgi:hypothetical protein
LQALFTGAAVPRPFVPDPTPLATLLRAGAADHGLVEAAVSVERHLLRYQVHRERSLRRAREEGRDAPLVASHVRQVRFLIDAVLVAAMARHGGDAWPELAALVEGEPGLLAAVAALAERVAAAPVAADRDERVDVARVLGRLPAHHALVRYRYGTRVSEAFVRTLQTRPLGRPVAIRPLGVPRSPLPPTAPPVATDDPAGDDPPPMFAPAAPIPSSR